MVFHAHNAVKAEKKVEEAINRADIKNNQTEAEENELNERLDEPVEVTVEEMELINEFLDV